MCPGQFLCQRGEHVCLRGDVQRQKVDGNNQHSARKRQVLAGPQTSRECGEFE